MHAKLHGDIVVEVFDLKLGAENVTQWILMTHFKKKKAVRQRYNRMRHGRENVGGRRTEKQSCA